MSAGITARVGACRIAGGIARFVRLAIFVLGEIPMPLDPMDEIFAEGQELSRKRFHVESQEMAAKEGKERRLRRVLRILILLGFAISILSAFVGHHLHSETLALLGLPTGVGGGIAFLVLLFKGGVAKPTYKDSFTRSARRRLRD
jgi:hypothetical protein